MKINSLLFLLLISVLFSACTEVLVVDLPTEEDKIVIEGSVTTETKPFFVKLSKAIALGQGSVYPSISNALVIIGDNVGNRDTLKLISPGVYKTVGVRTGVVGRIYFLSVTVNGVNYFGQDEILPVSKIDSVYAVFKKAGSGLFISDDGFYASFDYSDPTSKKNYYMYRLYKNGNPVLSPSEIAVYDDRFLAGTIKGQRLEGRYGTGDKIRLELYSLSESGYVFYNGLVNQLQNDGGFFSTPPANAISNMSGGAFGFFRASDISIDSTFIP